MAERAEGASTRRLVEDLINQGSNLISIEIDLVRAELTANSAKASLGVRSLLGGAGWLLGPLWAVAGILVGAVAALAVLLVMFDRSMPDPALLLRSGRPQEAYRYLQTELAFVRTLAVKRPMFRETLANRLGTMAQVLQALDNEPKALETVTEAVTIYGDLNQKLTEGIGPLFPISNYGAMKLAGEAALSAATESFLERAWIFRFPNVIGPRATHGVIYDLLRKLATNPPDLEVLGDGTQQKPYLHVSELIESMWFVSRHATMIASSRTCGFRVPPTAVL